LLVFNFSRQCIGSIPLSRSAAKVIASDPDRIGIMYLPFSEIPNETARFEWIDHNGKVLKSVQLYHGRPNDGGGAFAPARPYSFISGQLETPDYYFIRVIQKQQIKMVLYNKNNQAVSCLRPNDEYKEFLEASLGFANDLDGGIPFWPNSGNENQFVSMTAPEVLKPAFQDKPASKVKLKRPELRERLFKMVDQLKEDDNPVVVIVKIKMD
jgi:hypothetical protein